ncbi:CCN family member 5-like [Mytilus edulis]|uniref:CCN family member 5-like n=1 Tax=Mytilus edulis TaxID=6550 RepID=UPI0039EFBB57
MMHIHVFLFIVVSAGASVTAGSPSNCTDATFIDCQDTHVCSHTDLKKYCPLTCGICKPCQDESVFNCNQNVCSFPTLKKFCPVTCNSCSDATHNMHNTTQINSCFYKGKTYQEGEHFTDGCDYKCVCEDGPTGRYVCHSMCTQWNLPRICTLNPPAPGKCCKTPSCPSHMTISYPPGYIEQ